MSVFILTCKNCGHKFYDIVVLCTGEKVEDKCPACNSSNLTVNEMEKEKGKIWAEEEGCHHGDPSKFVHGEKIGDETSACGACAESSCNNCSSSSELSLDEEIDRRIKSNNSKFSTLFLPQELRKELQKPWGEIIEKVPLIPRNETTITVGDITTKKLISRLLVPHLAFVDHKVQRKEIDKKDWIPEKLFQHTFFFPNPDGQITRRLYQVVERFDWENKIEHTLVHIDGEEDLAALVCLLHAPIGAHIFYGQPDEGMVYMKITPDLKFKAEDIFNQFTESP